MPKTRQLPRGHSLFVDRLKQYTNESHRGVARSAGQNA